LLDHKNNYVERSNWSPECSNILQHCSFMLEHPNNFDNSIKLFSNLHLVKFINISAKSFFSCE